MLLKQLCWMDWDSIDSTPFRHFLYHFYLFFTSNYRCSLLCGFCSCYHTMNGANVSMLFHGRDTGLVERSQSKTYSHNKIIHQSFPGRRSREDTLMIQSQMREDNYSMSRGMRIQNPSSGITSLLLQLRICIDWGTIVTIFEILCSDWSIYLRMILLLF